MFLKMKPITNIFQSIYVKYRANHKLETINVYWKTKGYMLENANMLNFTLGGTTILQQLNFEIKKTSV